MSLLIGAAVLEREVELAPVVAASELLPVVPIPLLLPEVFWFVFEPLVDDSVVVDRLRLKSLDDTPVGERPDGLASMLNEVRAVLITCPSCTLVVCAI